MWLHRTSTDREYGSEKSKIYRWLAGEAFKLENDEPTPKK